MTIPRLLAIADGLEPIPHEKVDVRISCAFCGTEDHPLVRRLTRVVRQVVDGQRWIYWYWTPEPSGDVNGIDCGYSGLRFDDSPEKAA